VTDIGLNGDAAADRAELCGMLADQGRALLLRLI
jgi:hypothetical protein